MEAEFNKKYMIQLQGFIQSRVEAGVEVYPRSKDIFQAFSQTSFEKVKVVIIGQDPYHGENQAHGMSFSVNKGVKIPPSLKNIYSEIESDLGIAMPKHGCLLDWCSQGVFLLNCVLTVEKGAAGSHQKKGWEQFTDKVIEILNSEKENLVFMLWGAAAQKKGAKVDRAKHLVLESVHPSPLSAYRGFKGNKHFSRCNQFLKTNHLTPIDWKIQ